MENIIMVKLVILLGSVVGPIISLMVFNYLNILRDIKFKQLLMIILGGFGAAFLTMRCNYYVTNGCEYYVWRLFPSIMETISITLTIFIVIKVMKNCRLILNGLLVGAAVGMGFSVLETITEVSLTYRLWGVDKMVDSIICRAIISFGAHTAWAAVIGAAIMLIKNRKKYASVLIIFLCAILSICWNWYSGTYIHIPLMVLIWCTIHFLYEQGLQEVLEYVDNNETMFSHEDGIKQALKSDACLQMEQ